MNNYSNSTLRPNEKYLDPAAKISFPELTNEEWYTKYGKPNGSIVDFGLYITPAVPGNIKNIVTFFETKCIIGIILNCSMRKNRKYSISRKTSTYYIVFRLKEPIFSETIFGNKTIPNEYIEYGSLRYIEKDIYFSIALANIQDQVYVYEQGKEAVYRAQNHHRHKPPNKYLSYTNYSTKKVFINRFYRKSKAAS